MKLSIITICYNEKERITATIKSVLNQTFKDFQYIVIDGASTDGTVDIIKKYEDNIDLFITEADSGIYNAMNKGIDYCKGEYIYFLNAGDVLYKADTLEIILTYKLSGDIVYGNIAIKELSGKQWIFKMPHSLNKAFLLKKTIPHQATFTKRALFDKVGKYDEKYKIAADYKFSLQAIYKHFCRLQYISETFAIFDRSGIGFLNSEKRENEKKLIHNEVFDSRVLYYFRKVKKIILNHIKNEINKIKFIKITNKQTINFNNIPNPPIFDKEGLFIFFPNNKCGQTSITGGSSGSNSNGALTGRCIIKKVFEKKWLKYSEKNWNKAIKFTVVRHPYSRFLSTYRYLQPIYNCQTIDDFLKKIEQEGLLFDEHLQPQWTSAFDNEGNKFIDYILRLEHIENDWKLIKTKIAAKPFPKLNVTQVESKNNELSMPQKEFIYKLYEKDFLLFGFDK